jgi:GNAT superfamily N-acetyltransferase
MDEIRIEHLSLKHERAAFDCGKLALNTFLHKHALFNIQRGISRVYVATRVDASQVLAYYATSAGTFRRESLPPDDQAGLPGYPLPTVHLGRLAVDNSSRGKRLGETLLFHFLSVALDVADRIGVFGADLFAKDDDAKRFYLKYGFIPLRDNSFHFYLPMATVQAMFGKTIDS